MSPATILLHEQSIFDCAIWHFGPQDQARVYPSFYTIVPIGLVGQLINVEVNISIPSNIGTVRPYDARVPDVWCRSMRSITIYGLIQSPRLF